MNIFSWIFKKRELHENMYSAKISTFTVFLWPPLDKKLFPVDWPRGFKKGRLELFFMFFEKKVYSSSNILYIHSIKAEEHKIKIPNLQTGRLFGQPDGQDSLFFSKDGLGQNSRYGRMVEM